MGTFAGLPLFAPLARAATAEATPEAAALTDANILNFALNLEYLEAEFYVRAAFGKGLHIEDVIGVGGLGPVTGGRAVPFATPALQQFVNEIARDEYAHVKFLRKALGSAAVSRPTIDLTQSFTTAARAAGVIGPGQTFDPFADENSFLLAAYIFEDVGVTAYHGAAPFITNKDYLLAAAGILGTEAYHAAEIRTLIYQRGLAVPAEKITHLRINASGADDDQGVISDGQANIVPTDANGLVYARTPDQVLNIVYLGGAAGHFGFFPKRLNGAIN
ncbi:MAG TPA: ferritin-like domain-containing protein [Aliidongia sp.]|uniref:ferritin-like domain-containing protein n=1 Tax=Aliidongia sp. TaxID=1914230 RepID=UPI002DDD3DC1|nr:ferritin-like domain-containing protein [Aliidongia sp.]HEV2675318.1 ferritin-like domain-containing protein [Aliidongia sp.]